MYSAPEMQGEPHAAVLRLADKYKTYWRTRTDAYWFWRLFQEFVELGLSLIGLHKDPARWEKMQIAAICINWMRYREERAQ